MVLLKERGTVGCASRTNPTDIRARWLRITDAGMELVALAVKVVEANDAAFFAALEPRALHGLETANSVRKTRQARASTASSDFAQTLRKLLQKEST